MRLPCRPRPFKTRSNEARFDIVRNGRLFVSDQYLHSGDALVLSFESGYPDYLWLDQNILHFYRGQKFNGAKPDSLVVVNKTDKVIKYLTVYSTDKFLIFDLKPYSQTNLSISPSRGDFNGLSVKGEFAEEEILRMEQVLRSGKSYAVLSLTASTSRTVKRPLKIQN